MKIKSHSSKYSKLRQQTRRQIKSNREKSITQRAYNKIAQLHIGRRRQGKDARPNQRSGLIFLFLFASQAKRKTNKLGVTAKTEKIGRATKK